MISLENLTNNSKTKYLLCEDLDSIVDGISDVNLIQFLTIQIKYC